ncbi:hypothetical protein HDU90_008099 [Geranomyces variabilis]|nr:hypothetical protein HDU90_008099 [Geranomyces variabilis]
MSDAAAFVEAKRLQLEQLLETHAAALSLDNANVHLSYNDPITPDELPAFTWLSILYACTKERCLDPVRGLEGRFPSAVWDWVKALATELEPSSSDARARAVFAELRTVCVSWIGRVGLRRALSIWDLFCWNGDEAFFKQTGLRNMSELDTRRWLLDTVQIYGPNPDSFPYPEEVRLEIVHSKQLPNNSTDIESRRRLQLFQPFTHGSETMTWIAHERYPPMPSYIWKYDRQYYRPYKGYDIGSQEMFFVLPIAVTWAIGAALLIQRHGTSGVVPLPRGRFPFPPNKRDRGNYYQIAEPPFRAQCIMIEKKNPLVCQVCNSADNSSLNYDERVRLWAMRVQSEIFTHELEDNLHIFLRCYACWATAVHFDCWTRSNNLSLALGDEEMTFVAFHCQSCAAARSPQATLAQLPDVPLMNVVNRLDLPGNCKALVMSSRSTARRIPQLVPFYGSTLRMLKGLETFFRTELPQPNPSGSKDDLVRQLVAARDSINFLAAQAWERRPETKNTPMRCLGRIWQCYLVDHEGTAPCTETTVVKITDGPSGLPIIRRREDADFDMGPTEATIVYLAIRGNDVFPCFRRSAHPNDTEGGKPYYDVTDHPFAADLHSRLGLETMSDVFDMFKTAFPGFPRTKLIAQGASPGTTCAPLSPQMRELYEIHIPVAVPQVLLGCFENSTRPRAPLAELPRFYWQMIRAANLGAERLVRVLDATAKLSALPEMFLAAHGHELQSVLPGAYQWVVHSIHYTKAHLQMFNFNFDDNEHHPWTRERSWLPSQHHPWTAEIRFTICSNGHEEKFTHHSGYTNRRPPGEEPRPQDDYGYLRGALRTEWEPSVFRVERDGLMQLMTALDVDQRWRPADFALLLHAISVCPMSLTVAATSDELRRGPGWARFVQVKTVELVDSVKAFDVADSADWEYVLNILIQNQAEPGM